MTEKFVQKTAPSPENSPTILAPVTTDLMEVIQIGARRTRLIDLEPGLYAASAKEAVRVKKRLRVPVEEEFRYTYEMSRQEPTWHVMTYDFTKAVDLDARTPERAGWWKRLGGWLLRRSKPTTTAFPAARLLEPHLANKERA